MDLLANQLELIGKNCHWVDKGEKRRTKMEQERITEWKKSYDCGKALL